MCTLLCCLLLAGPFCALLPCCHVHALRPPAALAQAGAQSHSLCRKWQPLQGQEGSWRQRWQGPMCSQQEWWQGPFQQGHRFGYSPSSGSAAASHWKACHETLILWSSAVDKGSCTRPSSGKGSRLMALIATTTLVRTCFRYQAWLQRCTLFSASNLAVCCGQPRLAHRGCGSAQAGTSAQQSSHGATCARRRCEPQTAWHASLEHASGWQ